MFGVIEFWIGKNDNPFYVAKIEKQKLDHFCNLVKTNGKLDLKSKKKWEFKMKNKYYFDGIELDFDDSGNILFYKDILDGILNITGIIK